MPQAVTDQYLNQGILGLTVIVLLGVAVFLWREIKLERAEVQRLNVILHSEGKMMTEALVKAIASVDRAVDVFTERVRD